LEIWWEVAEGRPRTFRLEAYRRGVLSPADAAQLAGVQP